MKIQKRDIPGLSMRAALAPASVNSEKRTVDVTWTTGARVLRSSWLDGPFYEELSLDPKHVRMGRLASGTAPFLANHDGYDVRSTLGVIESAKLNGSEGTATVRFPTEGIDPDADKLFRKIQDGIVRNVSVGYRIYKMEKVEGGEKTTPVFRATDWEPHEVSAVAMGADPAAGFRAASDKRDLNPCEFVFTRGAPAQQERSAMDPEEIKRQAELKAAEEKRAAEALEKREQEIRAEAQKAERERVAGIQHAARAAGLDDDFVRKAIDGNVSVEKVRTEALELLAQRSEKTEINSHQRFEVGATDREKLMRHAEAGILFRAGMLDEVEIAKTRAKGALAKRLANLESDPGEFRGFSLVDIARRMVELSGVRTGLMSSEAIVKRALTMRGGEATAGDFTVLLENVMNKALLGQYALADDTWRLFCKTDTVQDFRASNRYRTGSFGTLDTVSEGGEFKSKPIPDGLKQSISVLTKGNMIAVSRQAIVNDDLGAILDTVGKFGRAAGLSIESDVYALINGNSGLGANYTDGNPFFYAARGNINGSGSTLGVQGLDADRVVLSQQKDPSSNEYLNLAKRGQMTLLVPVSLGMLARQLNDAPFDITQSNKFQVPNGVKGMYKQVVDSPRLVDTARRYTFADPSDAAAIVVAFLNGEQSPFMEQQLGWRVDGTEFKLRIDYQAQWFDPKGALTNAGA